jgi:hypothetical protein
MTERSAPANDLRAVCVYCGSRAGAQSIYGEEARHLGTGLARLGLELVYGGGHVGMMGTLADAALAAGGSVVGVIPQAMVEREWAHDGLTQLITVDNMHQRKATMATRAQAFIALPGGLGTLEELSEVLSWAQLSLHSHAVYLLNTHGYFDALLRFLDHCVDEAFLSAQHRDLLQVQADAGELLAELAAKKAVPHASSPSALTHD